MVSKARCTPIANQQQQAGGADAPPATVIIMTLLTATAGIEKVKGNKDGDHCVLADTEASSHERSP